jgi:pyruvate,water dikinase
LSNDYSQVNGLRGVSRFEAEETKLAFLLECDVIKLTQQRLADPTQLELVVPFVRTVSEAAKAIDILAGQGLARGANGLKVHLWCELPNNALLIDKFLPYFDGLMLDEVGLTQSTLSADLAHHELNDLFDAPDEGVRQLILRILNGAEKAKKMCDWVQRDQTILFEPIKENWTVNQFYRLP